MKKLFIFFLMCVLLSSCAVLNKPDKQHQEIIDSEPAPMMKSSSVHPIKYPTIRWNNAEE